MKPLAISADWPRSEAKLSERKQIKRIFPGQGCQMVHSQTQPSNFGIFLECLGITNFHFVYEVYFVANCFI
jgi:hypothetical protein